MLGPITILATNPTFTDPAIDLEEPPPADEGQPAPLSPVAMMLRYRETRDVTVLRLKPGVAPTEFVIKRMGAAFFMQGIRGASSLADQIIVAVCAACHEVRIPGDKPLKALTKIGVYGQPYAVDPAAWLQELRNRFGVETVEEIGRVAISLAKLRDEDAGPFA